METTTGFRRRYEQLISTLSIPDPFDMPSFLAGLARQRGKQIELIPAVLPTTLPCGMLVSTDDIDYIFHPIDTTPLHAQHIDMHEVGHLLLGHATGPTNTVSSDELPTLAEQAAVRSLLPDLSTELIRRILGRTAYSNAHEREAEVFASLLLARVNLPAVPPVGPGDFAAHLSRLRKPRTSQAGMLWAA